MANLQTGHVVRLVIETRGASQTGVVKNILHYRCNSEIAEGDFGAIVSNFSSLVLSPMNYNLPKDWHPKKVTLQRVWPSLDVSYEYGELGFSNLGKAVAVADCTMQAAACLTRKSWVAGRKGIGRFFFGPLVPRFLQTIGGKGDLLTEDPAGFGDLGDIKDALEANITLGPGVTLSPIIWGKGQGAPTTNNHIRLQNWSRRVSFLKTRKPDRGE